MPAIMVAYQGHNLANRIVGQPPLDTIDHGQMGLGSGKTLVIWRSRVEVFGLTKSMPTPIERYKSIILFRKNFKTPHHG